MKTQYCWIRVRVGWESIKLKAVLRVSDPPIQCLKLVLLERPRFASVDKLDDDAVFLNVSDPKPVVREWCAERGSVRELIQPLKKIVPADPKRHIQSETARW